MLTTSICTVRTASGQVRRAGRLSATSDPCISRGAVLHAGSGLSDMDSNHANDRLAPRCIRHARPQATNEQRRVRSGCAPAGPGLRCSCCAVACPGPGPGAVLGGESVSHCAVTMYAYAYAYACPRHTHTTASRHKTASKPEHEAVLGIRCSIPLTPHTSARAHTAVMRSRAHDPVRCTSAVTAVSCVPSAVCGLWRLEIRDWSQRVV